MSAVRPESVSEFLSIINSFLDDINITSFNDKCNDLYVNINNSCNNKVTYLTNVAKLAPQQLESALIIVLEDVLDTVYNVIASSYPYFDMYNTRNYVKLTNNQRFMAERVFRVISILVICFNCHSPIGIEPYDQLKQYIIKYHMKDPNYVPECMYDTISVHPYMPHDYMSIYREALIRAADGTFITEESLKFGEKYGKAFYMMVDVDLYCVGDVLVKYYANELIDILLIVYSNKTNKALLMENVKCLNMSRYCTFEYLFTEECYENYIPYWCRPTSPFYQNDPVKKTYSNVDLMKRVKELYIGAR